MYRHRYIVVLKTVSSRPEMNAGECPQQKIPLWTNSKHVHVICAHSDFWLKMKFMWKVTCSNTVEMSRSLLVRFIIICGSISLAQKHTFLSRIRFSDAFNHSFWTFKTSVGGVEHIFRVIEKNNFAGRKGCNRKNIVFRWLIPLCDQFQFRCLAWSVKLFYMRQLSFRPLILLLLSRLKSCESISVLQLPLVWSQKVFSGDGRMWAIIVITACARQRHAPEYYSDQMRLWTKAGNFGKIRIGNVPANLPVFLFSLAFSFSPALMQLLPAHNRLLKRN